MRIVRSSGNLNQLCCRLVRLEMSSGRPFHTTSSQHAASSTTQPTPEETDKATARKQADTLKRMSGSLKSKPEAMKFTPAERAAAAAKRSRDEQQEPASRSIVELRRLSIRQYLCRHGYSADHVRRDQGENAILIARAVGKKSCAHGTCSQSASECKSKMAQKDDHQAEYEKVVG